MAINIIARMSNEFILNSDELFPGTLGSDTSLVETSSNSATVLDSEAEGEELYQFRTIFLGRNFVSTGNEAKGSVTKWTVEGSGIGPYYLMGSVTINLNGAFPGKGGLPLTDLSTLTLESLRQVAGPKATFTLFGSGRNDKITGSSLADTLNGGAGKDMMTGGEGNDHLDGGSGADVMSGGLGDDIYVVGNTGDRVLETKGEGIDRVESSISLSLISKVHAAQDIENLTLTGMANLKATGNDLANVLIGNAGDNIIAGMGGKDKLTGGAGRDTFLFNTKLDAVSGRDNITDFNVKDDAISLDNAVFKALANTGKLPGTMFKDLGINNSKLDADDRIVYSSKTGNLFYDADGSGEGVAVLFARIENKAVLTAADFLIV